jgi:hypothetical protein
MIKETIDAWKNLILGLYEMLFVPHQEWKTKPETFRSFCLILGSLLIVGGLAIAIAWGLVFFLLSRL